MQGKREPEGKIEGIPSASKNHNIHRFLFFSGHIFKNSQIPPPTKYAEHDKFQQESLLEFDFP